MAENEKDDEEIILSYKNGSEESFKELIEKYTGPIFNFAARLAGRDKAPDIVQDVFIKVWKNISKFDSTKASFKTWIFTIARNTTTDFLRKRKDYAFSDMFSANEENDDSFYQNIPDEQILPDESLQKLQDKEFLNKILEKLKPLYREILVLHYQEEMTFDEISIMVKKPLNTVKSQHRRAIIELQKIIKNSHV